MQPGATLCLLLRAGGSWHNCCPRSAACCLPRVACTSCAATRQLRACRGPARTAGAVLTADGSASLYSSASAGAGSMRSSTSSSLPLRMRCGVAALRRCAWRGMTGSSSDGRRQAAAAAGLRGMLLPCPASSPVAGQQIHDRAGRAAVASCCCYGCSLAAAARLLLPAVPARAHLGAGRVCGVPRCVLLAAAEGLSVSRAAVQDGLVRPREGEHSSLLLLHARSILGSAHSKRAPGLLHFQTDIQTCSAVAGARHSHRLISSWSALRGTLVVLELASQRARNARSALLLLSTPPPSSQHGARSSCSGPVTAAWNRRRCRQQQRQPGGRSSSSGVAGPGRQVRSAPADRPRLLRLRLPGDQPRRPPRLRAQARAPGEAERLAAQRSAAGARARVRPAPPLHRGLPGELAGRGPHRQQHL